MNFLYPGFLFALLTIAIPIVIHLFNFRRFKKVYFSNVQFLKEIQAQNSSKDQLRHLLVLLSRILAIVFLVLAFARPYFSSSDQKDTKAGGNLVSVYIDNSYSMERLDKEGNLLDEAKRKAKELTEAYSLADQFRLLTNDFDGRHQRALNKNEFIGMLDGIKISAAGKSLQQILNRLAVDPAANKNHQAYLISDFQKGFVGTRSLQIDKEINYSLIKLDANPMPNIAVDSVYSLSPVHLPNQAEKFVVQLHNYGDQDAKDIPLKLTINQQQKALSTLTIPAGRSIRDTLSFSGLEAGWQKGLLSIRDSPLTFDDNLNFTFEVATDLKLLNIRGDSAERYIQSLFSTEAYFKLTEMPESNIRYAAFSDFNLIILDGLKEPSSGLAQQLRSYIENGGSVVIFPNLDAEAMYTSFLQALTLPTVQQLHVGDPIASTVELNNPVLEDVFEQVPKTIDLPVVHRYFSYAERSSGDKQSILDLPLNRFLLARYNLGEGKVYLSASSLDSKDGNLANHPVFVPIMFKIAFASSKEQPYYYTIGKNSILESPKISLSLNQSLKLVSTNFEAIPEIRQTPGRTRLYVADQVRQPGFYELKKADELLSVMAFNDDRTESDMQELTETEIKPLFGKQNIAFYNAQRDALAMNVDLKNNSGELWKLCLILAVVFLAVEILLIRFFNHTKNIQTT